MRDGQVLEVLVNRRDPRTVFIFHVLHLRPKTLDRPHDHPGTHEGNPMNPELLSPRAADETARGAS